MDTKDTIVFQLYLVDCTLVACTPNIMVLNRSECSNRLERGELYFGTKPTLRMNSSYEPPLPDMIIMSAN
jgi:hypothetical protein